jgi:hypothetical protein
MSNKRHLKGRVRPKPQKQYFIRTGFVRNGDTVYTTVTRDEIPPDVAASWPPLRRPGVHGYPVLVSQCYQHTLSVYGSGLKSEGADPDWADRWPSSCDIDVIDVVRDLQAGHEVEEAVLEAIVACLGMIYDYIDVPDNVTLTSSQLADRIVDACEEMHLWPSTLRGLLEFTGRWICTR